MSITREELEVGKEYVVPQMIGGIVNVTVTAIGDEYVLSKRDGVREGVLNITEALAYWSHVPTPQPEVPLLEWVDLDGSKWRLLPDRVEWRNGVAKWCHHVDIDDLAKFAASLHSSLKAYREIAERAQNPGELDQSESFEILRDLAALSPYPREEQ